MQIFSPWILYVLYVVYRIIFVFLYLISFYIFLYLFLAGRLSTFYDTAKKCQRAKRYGAVALHIRKS